MVLICICLMLPIALIALAGCDGSSSSNNNNANTGLPFGTTTLTQVQQGRALVLTYGCADCHNRGLVNPASANWLAGYLPGSQGANFQIGPFMTYAANITPD